MKLLLTLIGGLFVMTQGALAPQDPQTDIYQLGGGVGEPTLIYHVSPTYTAAAFDARLSGTVDLQAVVLASGSVTRVRVVHSLVS